jgi:hypothetical protein
MDMVKKISGIIGAVAAVTSLHPAQAAPQAKANPAEILSAASFGELLGPIQNASAKLAALEASATQRIGKSEVVELAYYHHHHHHHHHGAIRRFIRRAFGHHHHHHHHHHHRFRVD